MQPHLTPKLTESVIRKTRGAHRNHFREKKKKEKKETHYLFYPRITGKCAIFIVTFHQQLLHLVLQAAIILGLFLLQIKSKWYRYMPRTAQGGREGIAPTLSFLGTRRGWVVSITPRPRFTPGEIAPGTHCTGGWVGPRAGLDAEVRGKILCLSLGSNPGRSVRGQTLYWLSYPAHHQFTDTKKKS
jgi:hypothetical protein